VTGVTGSEKTSRRFFIFREESAMTVVEKYVAAIKNEKDPKKVIELWSKATKAEKNPDLTLKDIVSIHKECSKEITTAALSLDSVDFE
tara:strand:- start:4618 stop:4881 length:264 start_codon:yes stop_codon:yes gene_type:complete